MTTNLQNVFDAITGHDGSAATDGWCEMSRAELIAQARGQAESCYDPISDDEAARIADAVIARRACVDSCEIDYVRGTLGDAKLTALLRVDGDTINVPRALTAEQCAELVDAGLIVESGADDERPDRRYKPTDYARDLIWGRI